MSESEARRAGLLPPKRASKTKRSTPRSGALTRCVTHGGTFTTDAAETRHVEEHHGCRIELMIGEP